MYCSISSKQDVQFEEKKVNPWKSNYWYSNPDVFPSLLHGIVYQSGEDIPPR